MIVPYQKKLTQTLCRALVKCSKRFERQIERLGVDALPETELTLLRYLCPSYLKSLQASYQERCRGEEGGEEEERGGGGRGRDDDLNTTETVDDNNNQRRSAESMLLRRDIVNEFRKPLIITAKKCAQKSFDRRIDAAIGVLSTLNSRAALLEKTPAKARSSFVTNGVRVTASSSLIPEQSSPREQRFVYAYNVIIENESMTEPVQLISRRFEITDENGGKEFVEGHGVIGKQPVLDVGEHFEYTSAVPLKHLKGQMTGGYLMAAQKSGKVFEAKLAAFALKPTEPKAQQQSSDSGEEKNAVDKSKSLLAPQTKGRQKRIM